MTRDAHFGITEQERAGVHRREDARVLFEQARWRGSMYLAGYAVECLLKARLMRRYDCRTLRDLETELARRRLLAADRTVFTHQLEPLLRLTGARDRLSRDAALLRAFGTVNRWTPAWRYDGRPVGGDEASRFLDAVDQVLHWLRHNV